jgi:general secretion pathway protein A
MTNTTPFSLSPNPNAIHLTNSLKAVVSKSRFTIDDRQGLTCIVGDLGLGKSTVLRYLHTEYSANEECSTSLIPTPDFPSPFAMLKYICQEFSLDLKPSSVAQQRVLFEFLIAEYTEGRNVVIFIDEAQTLNNKQLELIRTMLNFETNTAKLVQFVLAGQIELRTNLSHKKNKHLASRVSTYSNLNPLTLAESKEMIVKRCEYTDISNPFTDDDIKAIYTKSGGIPRAVIKLCAILYKAMQDNALDKIPIEHINEAGEDVFL